jgi:hypothetical protein
MTNESLEYRLGCIDTKLAQNDIAHQEILVVLNKISGDLDTFKMKSIEDVSTIKGKASVWGAMAGFLASIIIAIIGWLVAGHR